MQIKKSKIKSKKMAQPVEEYLPAYLISNEADYHFAMVEIEKTGRTWCDGTGVLEFPYDLDMKYIVINEKTIQYWSNMTPLAPYYKVFPVSEIGSIV